MVRFYKSIENSSIYDRSFPHVRFFGAFFLFVFKQIVDTLNILANHRKHSFRAMLCALGSVCCYCVGWHERCKHFVKLFTLRANKNCSGCECAVWRQSKPNYMWKNLPRIAIAQVHTKEQKQTQYFFCRRVNSAWSRVYSFFLGKVP